MPGGELSVVNLNDVTVATSGKAVDVRHLRKKTVYVNVSVNTGAVTVHIEHSPDGVEWFVLNEKTYTASVENDDWTYDSHLSYIRTRTSAQANATVKTWIVGRETSGM
jgi:hypothetical protein